MELMVAEEIPSSEAGTVAPVLVPLQTGVSLFLSGILYSVPLACFTGAILADFSYVRDPDVQWSNFSSWLLVFGIIFLGFAIMVSTVRFLSSLTRKRRLADWLFGLFILAAAVTGLFDNFVHSHDGWTSVWPIGLTLSVLATLFIFIAMLLKVALLSNTYIVEA